MKRLAILLMLGALFAPSISAITIDFRTPGTALSYWGTGKKETYDVAVRIQSNVLEGMGVSGLRVPLPAPSATDCQGWIATRLATAKQGGITYNDPDIACMEAQVTNGELVVTFAQPYTITSGEFYVGYSFTISSKDDEKDQAPVAIYESTHPNGLFVRTSRGNTSWQPISEKTGMVSALEVVIDGTLPLQAAAIEECAPVCARPSETGTLNLVVSNHGSQPIEQMMVEWSLDNGQRATTPLSLPTPLPPMFNALMPISLPLAAVAERGQYEGRVKIVSTDGNDNPDDKSSAAFMLKVINYIPVRRVLMEEYTGTSCGWCPKGIACIEHLQHDFGDRFIAAAYHYDETMKISAPWDDPQQYPMCRIDGGQFETPAYRAMKTKVEGKLKQLPLAYVEVEAARHNDEIGVNTTVAFTSPWQDADFRVAYLLVADGLTGEGGQWMQLNSYSGLTNDANEDSYLEWWTQQPQYISNFTFNNVVVYSPDTHGCQGSLPTAIEADEPLTHSLTIPLAEVKNNSGMSLMQQQAHYRIVAFVINHATGEVVGAAECNVSDTTAAVKSATTYHAPLYYDLKGNRIASPTHGIYIKVIDGKAIKTSQNGLAK